MVVRESTVGDMDGGGRYTYSLLCNRSDLIRILKAPSEHIGLKMRTASRDDFKINVIGKNLEFLQHF